MSRRALQILKACKPVADDNNNNSNQANQAEGRTAADASKYRSNEFSQSNSLVNSPIFTNIFAVDARIENVDYSQYTFLK